MQATTIDAYKLFHEGSIALAQVEANGIRVNVPLMERTIEETHEKIRTLHQELREDPIFKEWKKKFGDKTKLTSREQLGVILFDVMDISYPVEDRTETGKYKTDESTFERLELPFVKKYLYLQKLVKARGTMEGIRREVCHGYMHPFFNLAGGDDDDKGGAVSFRSSSSKINFQNIYARNPEFSELIRKWFIPRKGRRIGEVDYSGIEVRIAACYHHDPVMIEYIKDPSKDMHRDMAGQIYMVEMAELNKEDFKQARYAAKNKFVFPQFYGDIYFQCAQNLWEWMERGSMKLKDSTPFREHLNSKGITKLGSCDPKEKPKGGTFELHIKEVEEDFWRNRFRVYGQWKDDYWNEYKRNAYFDLLTGFRIQGMYKKKEVLNYGTQGSAFHCLLWSLIQVQNWLNKKRMKTKIVGQIHDSIVSDIHPKEEQDYLAKLREVMTESILKAWDWIIVPLEIEVELTETDGNWFDKKKWVEKDGIWQEA